MTDVTTEQVERGIKRVAAMVADHDEHGTLPYTDSELAEMLRLALHLHARAEAAEQRVRELREAILKECDFPQSWGNAIRAIRKIVTSTPTPES